MDIRFTDNYKSIGPFEWRDVPDFVVLTGPNGCGKSQLLELLSKQVERGIAEGFSAKGFEILHLVSDWQRLSNVGPIDLGQLQSQSGDLWQRFEKFRSGQGGIGEWDRRIFDEIAHRLDKDRHNVTYDDFLAELPSSVYSPPNHIFNQTVGAVFLSYHVQKIERLAQGWTSEHFERVHGPPPWHLLKEILRGTDLPFGFSDPTTGRLTTSYKFAIRHTTTGKDVEFTDLSSGERVIISLVFWMFHFRREGNLFPKLMLLDEPDAHLHPPMTRKLLEVIHDTVVKKCGIRVIMTTHSPSTVALVPEDSLFEMEIGPVIRQTPSRDNAIRKLTMGFVSVSPGTQYALVEDLDDQKFYKETFDILAERGHVDPGIQIVFIPACGSGQRRGSDTSGGRKEVEKWVPRLQKSGLSHLIQGLVDHDNQPDKPDGVHLLARYSIENYLIDPILVFATLLDAEAAPGIPGVIIGLGEEHRLSQMDAMELEPIIQIIHGQILPKLIDLKEDEKELQAIQFCHDVTLHYPTWLVRRRGKNLLRLYMDHFGGKVINFNSLIKSYRKLRMVPTELANLFRSIQHQL